MLAHTMYSGHLDFQVAPLLMITFAHRKDLSHQTSPQHTLPCNNNRGCNMLAAAPVPIPSPSSHRSSRSTEEHSPVPSAPSWFQGALKEE